MNTAVKGLGVKPLLQRTTIDIPYVYRTDPYKPAPSISIQILSMSVILRPLCPAFKIRRACSFNHAHPTWIQRLVTEVAYADLCLAYSFCPSTAAFCGVSPLLSTTRAPIVLVTFNACLSTNLVASLGIEPSEPLTLDLQSSPPP